MKHAWFVVLLLPVTACGPVAPPTAPPPPTPPPATAAPPPTTASTKPSAVKRTGMKVGELYGEAVDAKDARKWAMDDAGVLTFTLSPDAPAGPEFPTTFPPLIGKKMTGDFIVTARLSATVPNEVAATRTINTPNIQAKIEAVVLMGVSVVSTERTTVGFRGGVLLKRWDDKWLSTWSVYNFIGGGGTSSSGKSRLAGHAAPAFVRLTRTGQRVTFETSEDGEKWREESTSTLPDTVSEVLVGPVAFACLDKECSVTFDEYEIKPLKAEKK